MPVFRLCFDLHRVYVRIISHVYQEAQLGADAEIRHGKEADLLNDRVACQLDLDTCVRMQVVNRHRRNLHDVANVEQVHPLRLVEVAEENAHVDGIQAKFEAFFGTQVLLLLHDPLGLVRI